MFAMTSTSLQITFFYVFATVIGQLITPFGFDSASFQSFLGILLNASGLLGAALAAFFFNGASASKFRRAAIMCGIFTIMAFAYFTIAVKTLRSETHIAIATACVGFFNLPMFMIGYELAVRQTLYKGIGEALSCGLINLLANFLGFVWIIILTPYLASNTEQHALTTIFFNAGMLLISVIMMICVKTVSLLD